MVDHDDDNELFGEGCNRPSSIRDQLNSIHDILRSQNTLFKILIEKIEERSYSKEVQKGMHIFGANKEEEEFGKYN